MKFSQIALVMFLLIAIAACCSAETASGGFKSLISEPGISQETFSRVEQMLPVFDSIIRVTHEKKSIPADRYLSSNPELVWNILYHLCVNFGQNNPLVELQEDRMKVPSKVMQEFATACFADFEDLVAVPTGFEQITFSKELNAYMLAMSDMGATSCSIIEVKPCDNDSFKVRVNLIEDETSEDLDSRDFLIVPNRHIEGTTDSSFYFSVAEVNEAK